MLARRVPERDPRTLAVTRTAARSANRKEHPASYESMRQRAVTFPLQMNSPSCAKYVTERAALRALLAQTSRAFHDFTRLAARFYAGARVLGSAEQALEDTRMSARSRRSWSWRSKPHRRAVLQHRLHGSRAARLGGARQRARPRRVPRRRSRARRRHHASRPSPGGASSARRERGLIEPAMVAVSPSFRWSGCPFRTTRCHHDVSGAPPSAGRPARSEGQLACPLNPK
jgi:hypothetical protein